MSHFPINTVTAVLTLVLRLGGAVEGPAPNIPCMSFEEDSSYPLLYEETLNLAIQAVDRGRAEPDKDDRKCYLGMAEALARHLVVKDRADPAARYWYAAALGLRAAEEGGRTQVSYALLAHEQAHITLTIVPDHAGAQHVVGRIHAAVMRLSGFKRWVATQILGGKALSGASWESAESFLAAAARLQPELPSHHYELAALYLDTDRPEAALEAFKRALRCPPVHPADNLVQARAREVVGRLQRGEPVEDEPERATGSHAGRRRAGGRG